MTSIFRLIPYAYYLTPFTTMSKNAQFQKFINKKSNAAVKEQFKQEKKAAKKERAAAIEKRYEQKRQEASQKRETGQHQKPGARNAPPAPDSKSATPASTELMPLNKYIAHSGICSRRDAADLVKRGEVRVNDKVITEPGTKVSQKDLVTVKGKKITISKNLVYILLNKPKDYITTLEDPEGRKTVLDLIRRATPERVYPIGRLDRNTSGVLLLTNDGELAQTLSHPKHQIKKIYEVRLDKALTKADFDKLLAGINLEDGFIAPDAVGYVDNKDKSIIGMEIHSGRNRIVRRIFEHLGYDVKNLDRVMYAGLTKKNVQRGKWRFLTEKEIRILRHFNPQTKKKAPEKVKSAHASGKPTGKPVRKP
jgi:23S rRNA pseudouridine2605 synthase